MFETELTAQQVGETFQTHSDGEIVIELMGNIYVA